MDFDLAIVGLGPVGAVAANLAGQQGLKVLAVDKLAQIYDKPRAFGLDHEIMRVFGNIGIAGDIAKHIMPYRPSEYHTSGARVLKRIVAASPPFPLGWEANYVFSQPAIEAALRQKAQSNPNIQVELATTVLDTVRMEGGHELHLRAASGEERRITARYVLACDGGSSPLRAKLGLEMEDLLFDEPWLVVDVLVDPNAVDRLPATNIQYCETERPCTYVVGPGRHRRWEFMINPGEAPDELAQPQAVEKLMARWLAPHEYEFWRASAYRFHALVLRRWRADNIFFMGDAAHMTPPFMAQGMCQGIRDAANLIWKLALVNKGHAPDSLLNSYEQERIPHVRHTTLVAKELGRVICERDPAKAALRDERMLAEMERNPAPTIRQSLIPGLSCGFVAAAGQASAQGDLFPQPMVSNRNGQAGLLDEVTGMSFRLVVAHDADCSSWQQAASHWQRQVGIPLVLIRLAEGQNPSDLQHDFDVLESDGVLKKWMADRECKVVLVRPDHYVYGACATFAQGTDLLHHLQQHLATTTA
ncbi:bifunctional 3-(3-hydroxy-phenyl)propionate/3-hydroxycinnamic acid hydroxylase [Eoetvoesiella caeni]|uniref:3-(3-hydroxy-phenyl)propionate hydroxylase n=1 Tax=Eoetvoesiella caeni TaxID=645616 RepID=A0A366HGW8_9BURK|nr:bifunctional 3-(3-hydroxy-phenyl)propionate/3-hydroxycinnamic acid hydroxylase [Eoetvoesiella caeni]MCI2807891.1 bifunctional 3-(3-hydroxy-phenyl)propionate/3-hydroxycinnamic acid hydroxylase [Eoetvoesiella caeni]NYT54107.1 bifunctional 3-(3-hydroxy-phenyl)propionate/3-hydroxycinnamic acid hydroxylase [Eoetvoesiella caeni]RBP41809.1 3-(3-hydroxy-phenyl)propionate hydroxylase [Eoetvoesiella caeni]